MIKSYLNDKFNAFLKFIVLPFSKHNKNCLFQNSLRYCKFFLL